MKHGDLWEQCIDRHLCLLLQLSAERAQQPMLLALDMLRLPLRKARLAGHDARVVRPHLDEQRLPVRDDLVELPAEFLEGHGKSHSVHFTITSRCAPDRQPASTPASRSTDYCLATAARVFR